jgi:hypothetical protein
MADDTSDIVQKIKDLQQHLVGTFRKHIPGVPGGKYELALEQTQYKIMLGLNKMANIQSTASSTIKKQKQELHKSISGTNDGIVKENRARNTIVSQISQNVNYQKRSDAKMRSALEYMRKKVTGIPAAFRKFKDDDRDRSFERERAIERLVQVSKGDLTDMATNLSEALGGTTFATIIESIISGLKSTVSIYQQLNEAGQGFGGSLLQMEQTAAAAGVPLQTFAKIVIDNSAAVSALGGPAIFGKLFKDVRNATRGMGQYGLTIEQSGEYFGQYLETERKTGGLNVKNNSEIVHGFVGLLDNVDKVSKQTGVQRKTILDEISSIKQSAEVFGLLHSSNKEDAAAIDESFTKMAARFASIPGTIGKELTQAVVEGTPIGSVVYGELGQQLNKFAGPLRVGLDNILKIQAGGGNVDAAQQQLEDQAVAMSKDVNYMRQLTIYANTVQDAGAKKSLQVIGELSRAAETRAKNERQPRDVKEATKAFLNFENAMQNALGTIKEGFLKGLGPFADNMNQWLGVDGKHLLDLLGNLGEHFGKIAGEILNPGTLDRVSNGFGKILNVTGSLIRGVLWLDNIISPVMRQLKSWNEKLFGTKYGAFMTVLELGTLFLFRRVLARKLLGLMGGVFKGFMPRILAAFAGTILAGGAYKALTAAGTTPGTPGELPDDLTALPTDLFEEPGTAAKPTPPSAPVATPPAGTPAARAPGGGQAQVPGKLEGGDKRTQAIAYFMSQGLTKEQASGMVASLFTESNLRNDVYGHGAEAKGMPGEAYGIAQWHKDRQAEFAKFIGHDIHSSTFEEQLAFAYYEITSGKEQTAGRMIRGARTAYEAGAASSTYYERPKDKYGNAIVRGNLAEKFNALPLPTDLKKVQDQHKETIAMMDDLIDAHKEAAEKITSIDKKYTVK